MTIIFIAGGARSGKSCKGEELAISLADLSGIMNQEFAKAADKVYFMKFGIAQELK